MSSWLRVICFIPHEIVPVQMGLFVGSVRQNSPPPSPSPSKPLTAGEKAKQN